MRTTLMLCEPPFASMSASTFGLCEVVSVTKKAMGGALDVAATADSSFHMSDERVGWL